MAVTKLAEASDRQSIAIHACLSAPIRFLADAHLDQTAELFDGVCDLGVACLDLGE